MILYDMKFSNIFLIQNQLYVHTCLFVFIRIVFVVRNIADDHTQYCGRLYSLFRTIVRNIMDNKPGSQKLKPGLRIIKLSHDKLYNEKLRIQVIYLCLV